jgi:hypothetical protein
MTKTNRTAGQQRQNALDLQPPTLLLKATEAEVGGGGGVRAANVQDSHEESVLRVHRGHDMDNMWAEAEAEAEAEAHCGRRAARFAALDNFARSSLVGGTRDKFCRFLRGGKNVWNQFAVANLDVAVDDPEGNLREIFGRETECRVTVTDTHTAPFFYCVSVLICTECKTPRSSRRVTM